MRVYRSRAPSDNVKGVREPYTEREMIASLMSAYSRPARSPWDLSHPQTTRCDGGPSSQRRPAAITILAGARLPKKEALNGLESRFGFESLRPLRQNSARWFSQDGRLNGQGYPRLWGAGELRAGRAISPR